MNMKLIYSKFVVLLLVTIQICLIKRINADIEDDTWMEPDAWARDYSSSDTLQAMGKCCKCPEDVTENNGLEKPITDQQKAAAEDSASLIYFKKFITILFNRKHFKYDSKMEIYERSIEFSVPSSQLDKLEELQDARDLDTILEDIFNNVRTPKMHSDGRKHLHTTASSGFKAILFEILYDMWQITKTSEMKFLLVVILVILIGWLLNKRFRTGWVSLIFGGLLIYGYLHTYLECNRELEANEMLEILNRDKEITSDSKFVKFFKNIFYSPQDDLQEKFKKSAKLSLGFCRPDHVLIKYFNDIFLHFLQMLLEKCTDALTNLNSNLGFPYNILSGVMLIFVIGYTIKLTFKYILSPSAWIHFMQRKQPYQTNHEAIKSRSNSQSDRISGDNLKLLLTAISNAPQGIVPGPKLQIATAVSGVEEVKEAIEPPPKNNSPKFNKSENVKSQNNNNSSEKSSDEITDVTLEDLSEDL